MSILLLLATLGLGGIIGLSIVITMLQGRPVRSLAITLLVAFGGWCVVYCGLLVGTSLASEARVLGRNEFKRYCGFYLDCHLHASVVDVDSAINVGASSGLVAAKGMFMIVTVRVSSDALREPTHFVGPRAVVRDNLGREYQRVEVAEAAMATAYAREGSGVRSITDVVAAGDSFLTVLVFDVPVDANGLTLDVTDGYTVDRVIERFMIGDDDSAFHKPTAFRLAR